MKNNIIALALSGIFVALIAAGCGGTPQVSSAADVAAVKNNQAQHDADLAKQGAASGRKATTTGQ